MADKIDFSKVPGGPKRTRALVGLREPLWKDQHGKLTPVSQLENSHLQNVERFLRGGGAVAPGRQASAKGLKIIQDEMKRRQLPVLTDHPAAYARNRSIVQQRMEAEIRLAKAVSFDVPFDQLPEYNDVEYCPIRDSCHTTRLSNAIDEWEASRADNAKQAEVLEGRLSDAIALPPGNEVNE